jgi:hypothetical protein
MKPRRSCNAQAGILSDLPRPAPAVRARGQRRNVDEREHPHPSVDHPGTAHGTFTATPPLCQSGTFVDEVKALGGAFTGVANTTLFTGTIVKHFVCDDGTGTFQIQFHLHLQPDAAQSSGPWAIVGGTGKYSTLHGSGDFSVGFLPGKFLVEGFETFTGQVHFD